MPLIKDGVEAEDNFTLLGDADLAAAEGDVILSIEQLKQLGDNIKGRNARTGVVLQNTGDVQELLPYIDDLQLVVLEFPAFADGRAYSQAWQLRQDLNFDGEVRATGNVLPDQAAYMMRSGFNSFELEEGRKIETLKNTLGAMTHAYQRGFAEASNAFRRQITTGK